MLTHWNPTANFTIASASSDKTIKVWDIKNEKSRLNYNLSSSPTSLQWNLDGELICCITKDHKMTIFDPRLSSKAIVMPSSHFGKQSDKMVWLGDSG